MGARELATSSWAYTFAMSVMLSIKVVEPSIFSIGSMLFFCAVAIFASIIVAGSGVRKSNNR